MTEAVREALHKIRHTGTIGNYVKAYSATMLEILDMCEVDRLYFFIKRLQTLAQLEIRQQAPKDLKAAYATADALVDLRGRGRTSPTAPAAPTKPHSP